MKTLDRWRPWWPIEFWLLLLAVALGLGPEAARGAVGGVIGGTPGGSVPGAVVLAPGSGFTAALAAAQNGQTFVLGDGLYTVTPSILDSNLINGTTFTGAQLLNKTNITIVGIPGQSIIDGRGALGELLWISNCSQITISGLTFRGLTNHNYMALPREPNKYLWASINLYKSERVTFDNCTLDGFMDHGIQDHAAVGAGVPANTPQSTNQIVIRNCLFTDGGSWRTNNSGGQVDADGTAIIPTGGWTIEGCHFESLHRAIEPYDQNDPGVPFSNLVIRDNTARNVIEFFLSPASSTNCHGLVAVNNWILNDRNWSFRGTNYGVTGSPWPAIGFILNGGRNWQIRDNTIRGGFYNGILAVNTSMPVDDCLIEGNVIMDIDRGDGLGIGIFTGEQTDSGAAARSVRNLVIRNNTIYRPVGNGFFIAGGRDVLIDGNTVISPTAYSTMDAAYAGFRFGCSIGTAGGNRLTNVWARRNNVIQFTSPGAFAYGFEQGIFSLRFEDNLINGHANYTTGMTNKAGAAVLMTGAEEKFSFTLDFASTGPGASTTLTTAAAGVMTNDLVFLSWPAQVMAAGNCTNVYFSAWGSNDVIYVRAHNANTVNSQDPPSVRFQATVRRGEAFRQ